MFVRSFPSPSFRGDIEGLRALAVLSILLFHVDASLSPGGFAGVDIFFVISGFLITGQIVAQGDEFRFRDFYIRRARRLVPALFVTVLLSLVAGWSLFSPRDYAALAKSALASLAAIANIYFWLSQNYFDASNLTKPLLHVWSLSLEEQFYLVWPALLLIARRWTKALSPLVVSLALLSLAASVAVARADASAGFYLTPFRAFEFALGGWVWLARAAWTPRTAHALGVLGAVAMLASFAIFDSATPWPAANALLPAGGAALFIAAGPQGIVNRAMANAVFRLIGRASYSIYLVHWPLIVFYAYWQVVPLSRPDQALLFAGSLIGGVLMFLLVEQPLRMRPRGMETQGDARSPVRRAAMIAAVLTPVAAAAFAIMIIVDDGAPRRTAKGVTQKPGELSFAGDACNAYYSRCSFGDPASQRVVYLVGDSHALNLVHGLDRLFRERGYRGVALYDHGCLFLAGTRAFARGAPDKTCAQNIAAAFRLLAADRRPVILAGEYAGYEQKIGPDDGGVFTGSGADYLRFLGDHLRRSLEAISAGDRVVILMKETYRLGLDLPNCLARPNVDPAQCAPTSGADAKREAAPVDAMIDAARAPWPDVVALDPKSVFCATEPCVVRDGAALYFRDDAHLTNEGSDFLIGALSADIIRALEAPVARR